MNPEPMRHWIETELPGLRGFFKVTDDRWNHLVRRLQGQLDAPRADFYDEVVWTFLLGLSYAAGGWEGIRSLQSLLSGREVDSAVQHPLWLEALPVPPRKSEGNTNVDLAFGAITDRPGKEGGIAFDPALGTSITFCEMKWYSDISKSVTHDQHRNQLSRVIENAVTFQGSSKHDGTKQDSAKRFVDQVTVTLVTPRIFVGTEPKSRLYHYKIEEYKDPEVLLREWKRSYEQMPKRSHGDWEYPDESHLRKMLEPRNGNTGGFTLQHLSFEELFENAPKSTFTPVLTEFLLAANGSGNRYGCNPSA